MVPKLILLFTTEGWSVQPYSINFEQLYSVRKKASQLSKIIVNNFFNFRKQFGEFVFRPIVAPPFWKRRIERNWKKRLLQRFPGNDE